MRYFRYKDTGKTQQNVLKEQYKALTRDEKRIFRKRKRWSRFGAFVACSVFVICLAVGIVLLAAIPRPDVWFLKLLVLIGKVAAGAIVVIVSSILAAGLALPLWEKAESYRIPSMKKEILSKACRHLRNYYGLQEPYIVTKCFSATDQNFQWHDVCIFISGDELRLTADLVRGFLDGSRDLGCYAFKRDEITLTRQQDGNHQVAELRADNAVFVLGDRARSFISKSFLIKESDRS